MPPSLMFILIPHSAFLESILESIFFSRSFLISWMHSHIANPLDFQVSSSDTLIIALGLMAQSFKDTNLNVVSLQYRSCPLSSHCLGSPWVISFTPLVLIQINIDTSERHICIPALYLSSKPIPLLVCGPYMPYWHLELNVLKTNLIISQKG